MSNFNDLDSLPALRELYIGRNLEGLNYIDNDSLQIIEYGDCCTKVVWTSECKSLKKITIGKNITEIKSSIAPETLEELYVKSSTPPTVTHAFENKTYMNAKLYVPKESLEEYKKADVWKDFWNIEGYDFSTGISAPTVDKTNKLDVIYDLNGRKLSKPQKGINIINGKKVVVK